MTSSSGGAGGPHTSASGSDTRITLQPPLPPLDDAQRRQAAVSLQRSRQLQQQPGFKLQLSTQLDLLVLQPLSLYQQYSRGVGVYAGRSDAACQTRQLEQDIREQDVQTEQVRVAVSLAGALASTLGATMVSECCCSVLRCGVLCCHCITD